MAIDDACCGFSGVAADAGTNAIELLRIGDFPIEASFLAAELHDEAVVISAARTRLRPPLRGGNARGRPCGQECQTAAPHGRDTTAFFG